MKYETAIAKLEFLVTVFNESEVFRAALADLRISANGVSFLSEVAARNLPAIDISYLTLKADGLTESLYEARNLFLDIHLQATQPFFHRIIIYKGENTLELFTIDIYRARNIPDGPYLVLTIKTPKEQIQGLLVTFFFSIKAMPDMFLVIQNEVGPLPHYPTDKPVEEILSYY